MAQDQRCRGLLSVPHIVSLRRRLVLLLKRLTTFLARGWMAMRGVLWLITIFIIVPVCVASVEIMGDIIRYRDLQRRLREESEKSERRG